MRKITIIWSDGTNTESQTFENPIDAETIIDIADVGVTAFNEKYDIPIGCVDVTIKIKEVW